MHMLRKDGITQSFLLINIFISLSTICQKGSRDFIGLGKSTKSTACEQALSRGGGGRAIRTARGELARKQLKVRPHVISVLLKCARM